MDGDWDTLCDVYVARDDGSESVWWGIARYGALPGGTANAEDVCGSWLV